MKVDLNNVNIKLRVKRKGDTNALGVVDKAIQHMKNKLFTVRGTEGGNWEANLARDTKIMNDTPKPDVLYGEALTR